MTRNPESSVGGYADWIEWEYEGGAESPGGGLEETNFTIRTVWTVIDLLAAPIRLEPVTAAANEAGTVVNPAAVAVNGVAVYRVEVVPAGIVPDEAVHWSKSSDNVTFYAGQNTGREAYIRGVTAGDFTLEISVDGFPDSYRPYIHGKVLEPTVTPIHVYIICDAAGSPAVDISTVNAWVAEANRIYRQAAMSFYVAGVEYLVHTNWYVIDNPTEFRQMCSYANNTGGLELYCVGGMSTAGRHSDMGLPAGNSACGMAVKHDANLNTLAHEIGHACNLRDIIDRPTGISVSESLSGMQNWSGGEGTGYHAPDLIHTELVRRLLMFYMGNPQKTDIPLEAVTGRVPGASSDGFISVGLNDMRSREPLH